KASRENSGWNRQLSRRDGCPRPVEPSATIQQQRTLLPTRWRSRKKLAYEARPLETPSFVQNLSYADSSKISRNISCSSRSIFMLFPLPGASARMASQRFGRLSFHSVAQSTAAPSQREASSPA